MSRSSEPEPTACFSVQARRDPQIMPRVLELFAKRGLVPDAWHSTVAPDLHHDLHIDIQVNGLSPALFTYIAECLRRIVGVKAVLTTEKRHARRA